MLILAPFYLIVVFVQVFFVILNIVALVGGTLAEVLPPYWWALRIQALTKRLVIEDTWKEYEGERGWARVKIIGLVIILATIGLSGLPFFAFGELRSWEDRGIARDDGARFYRWAKSRGLDAIKYPSREH